VMAPSGLPSRERGAEILTSLLLSQMTLQAVAAEMMGPDSGRECFPGRDESQLPQSPKSSPVVKILFPSELMIRISEKPESASMRLTPLRKSKSRSASRDPLGLARHMGPQVCSTARMSRRPAWSRPE